MRKTIFSQAFKKMAITTEKPARTRTDTNAASEPKAVTSRAYASLLKIAKETGHESIFEPLYSAKKRFELGIFRLVVMGEIKKGKSSFINALLGAPDLLPVATDVATSTVFKLLYGPINKQKVFFKQNVETYNTPDPLAISKSEVAAYGTESGNPKNEKEVDFIGIECPSPILEKGLVIIDTPGVGGLHRAHRDITLRYAPSADAIIFVLDSVESVISEDEVLFLKDLRANATKRIFFVQTKTDAADEESWMSWKERNQTILSESVGIPIDEQIYFSVSAKMKFHADARKSGSHLKRSGFLDVLNYLNHSLIPAKESAISKEFGGQLAVAGHRMNQQIEQRMKILGQESGQTVAAHRQELMEFKRRLESWRRNDSPLIMKGFGADVSKLQQACLLKMREAVGPQNRSVDFFIDTLRSGDLKGRTIAEQAEELQDNFLVQRGLELKELQKGFNADFMELFADCALKISDDVETFEILNAIPRVENDLIARPLHITFSNFGLLRNTAMGGSIGGSLATAVVVAASFLVPPVAVLIPFAGFIGGGVGAAILNAEQGANEKEQVLMRLENSTRQLCSRLAEICGDSFRAETQLAIEKAQALLLAAIGEFEDSLCIEIEETKRKGVASAERSKERLEELTANRERLLSALAGLTSISN